MLIAERPAMTVDPELFRSHGIEPLYCKIVVVKSPNGFRAAYEPIAKRIILVDTPGVSTAPAADVTCCAYEEIQNCDNGIHIRSDCFRRRRRGALRWRTAIW